MTTDLNLFSKIANRLIYLTTRDEYGSSRSRGIENLEDLTDELNDFGIVPSRGFWTENSLKLFLNRIRKRYPIERIECECDLDFLGRQSWEYQSYTKHEDVCEHRNVKPDSYWSMPSEPYPLDIPSSKDDQRWKPHEVDEVLAHDKKMLNILKSVTPKRQFVN